MVKPERQPENAGSWQRERRRSWSSSRSLFTAKGPNLLLDLPYFLPPLPYPVLKNSYNNVYAAPRNYPGFWPFFVGTSTLVGGVAGVASGFALALSRWSREDHTFLKKLKYSTRRRSEGGSEAAGSCIGGVGSGTEWANG